MFKYITLGLLLLSPALAQAQKTPAAMSEADKADKMVCVDKDQAPAPPKGKKPKKTTLADKVVPLSLVVCEVENALNAYQQSDDVDKNILPKISTADFDFKTVVDTKGSLGIGLFIFKLLGGSVDKQQTDDVDFQFVPKSLLKTGLEARKAKTFQDELLAVIIGAAKAVKEEQGMPASPSDKDPLVFKQLTVTVSYGVTTTVSVGLSIPISIVTLTAQLDRTKNNVQSVKLVFAPPPKPKE